MFKKLGKTIVSWFQKRIEGMVPKGKFWWWKAIKLFVGIWILVTFVKAFLLFGGWI